MTVQRYYRGIITRRNVKNEYGFEANTMMGKEGKGSNELGDE